LLNKPKGLKIWKISWKLLSNLAVIWVKKKETYFLSHTRIPSDPEDLHGELSHPSKKDKPVIPIRPNSSLTIKRKSKKSSMNSVMTSSASSMKTSYLKLKPLNAKFSSSKWKVTTTDILVNTRKIKKTKMSLTKPSKLTTMPPKKVKLTSRPPTQSDSVSP